MKTKKSQEDPRLKKTLQELKKFLNDLDKQVINDIKRTGLMITAYGSLVEAYKVQAIYTKAKAKGELGEGFSLGDLEGKLTDEDYKTIKKISVMHRQIVLKFREIKKEISKSKITSNR